MANDIRTICPATHKVIFEKPGVSLDQAKQATISAAKAFQSYQTTALQERKTIITRALDIIESRKDELAQDITAQIGRPIRHGAAELNTTRRRAEYLMEIAEESLAPLPGKPEAGFQREVKRVPLGPILISSAWNYPFFTAINALIPALLAGNTVILCPSPQTPIWGEKINEIFTQAGLPANVLQVLLVPSIDRLAEIVQLPEIKSVSFTGSTAGGVKLREATARHIKPIHLELGGNDPAYVRPDVNVKEVAEDLVDGAVFNSGQSCCAVERVYVHERVFDEFVRAVQEELKSYKLGDPLDKTTTTGPVISSAAKSRIQSHIADALQKGAVDVTPKNESFNFAQTASQGNFLAPIVLTNVNHSMVTMKEETFGPVMPIMKVSSDEEAVSLMNDSHYGLTASVWTKDTARGEELIESIEAGTVFINRCDYPSPDLAWTGWKDSGLGCTLGPRAYDGFVQLKSFHIKEGSA